MKKFFTLVAMAMMAVGMNAQVLIAEQDFTGGFEGDYPYWSQFDASQTDGSIASDPEGVAITVGIQTGQLWQPQVMVIPDGGVSLEEDGNYKVVVVAKFPTDGTLQINMGSWSGADQYTVDVVSTGDFQTVEVEFPAYAYTTLTEDGNPNGHVLFQCGDFKGTTILKKVQVYDLDGGSTPEPPAGEAVIASNDFTGGFEGDYPYWYQFDASQTDGSVTSDPEGVAITVGTQTGQLWQPQVMVIPDGGVSLEEDGNYKVVVVAKFPCDGTLQINMGSWSGADQYTVDVVSTGDFQEIEVEFPAYAYTTLTEDGTPNGHVLFQCGDFKGTTIVKSVKVINLDGATGIAAVKANKATNGVIYNLAGQKVNANYKGVVIQNGKKFLQK